MKIGVSATGGAMDAAVEPRLGRCPFFVIVDSETMRFETFTNPATDAAGGAGPQTVQQFASRGAQVVLTGQVGPKAQTAFDAAGIEVVTGVSGKVRQAVEAYLKSRG